MHTKELYLWNTAPRMLEGPGFPRVHSHEDVCPGCLRATLRNGSGRRGDLKAETQRIVRVFPTVYAAMFNAKNKGRFAAFWVHTVMVAFMVAGLFTALLLGSLPGACVTVVAALWFASNVVLIIDQIASEIEATIARLMLSTLDS